MDQLIQAFGLDAKLVVIQIINFAVMVALLSYFLYKPLLNMLDERERTIAKGVKDAEDAAAAKAEADTAKQATLAKAHQEAEAINARAKESADVKANDIVATANTKADEIVKDAEQKREDIKAQAHKESEAEIAKLAVLAAEKVLAEKQA